MGIGDWGLQPFPVNEEFPVEVSSRNESFSWDFKASCSEQNYLFSGKLFYNNRVNSEKQGKSFFSQANEYYTSVDLCLHTADIKRANTSQLAPTENRHLSN